MIVPGRRRLVWRGNALARRCGSGLQRSTVAAVVGAWLMIGCAGQTQAPTQTPPQAQAPSATSASTTTADTAPADEAARDAAITAAYAERARAGDTVFHIDPNASSLRIVAFRAGRSARLGHNHVLTAPHFTGACALPADGAAGGRFDLAFRLDALVFDDPAQRTALGPAFASTLSAAAIAGTRDHLLGDDGLQAARWPVVRIRSLRIVGEAPVYAAEVEVELHGQRRSQPVALSVSGLPERLVASGALVLRQSDFGVRPYSVAGGLLAMADEVVIDFRLVGAR